MAKKRNRKSRGTRTNKPAGNNINTAVSKAIRLSPQTLTRLRRYALSRESGTNREDSIDTIINTILDIMDSKEGTAEYIQKLTRMIRLYEAIIDKDRVEGEIG